jgi:MFS family permease
VAELGGERLRGRYFALHSMSWGLGGAAGPALGGLVLAASAFALWPLAAGVCAFAALWALALERRVPPGLRRIPRGEREPDAAPALGAGLGAEAPG